MLARCRKEAHGTLGLLLLYSVLFYFALLSKVIVSSGLARFKYFVLFTIRSTVCLTEPCAFKRQISRQNDCMQHGKTNAETEQTRPRTHTSQHLVNMLHKPQTESCGMRHTLPAPIARNIKRQSVLRREEGG